MQCCPSNGLVAYGGEDGEVAIFKDHMLLDNRQRKPHIAVAGQHLPCPKTHMIVLLNSTRNAVTNAATSLHKDPDVRTFLMSGQYSL